MSRPRRRWAAPRFLKTGDLVELDVEAGRIDMRVERGRTGTPPGGMEPTAPLYGRSFAALYQRHVSQADQGCDFDFLSTPDPVSSRDLLRARHDRHREPFQDLAARGGPASAARTWLMAAAPATAEAMGYTGFDFLVVDMEHVPIEVSDLAQILRASAARRPMRSSASPGTIRCS